MKTWLLRHLQVLFATLGNFKRTPLTALNTILVIAISMLLPTLLYIVVKSATALTTGWQGQPQISIFLQKQLTDDEAQLIFEELRLHPAIELAEFVSPAQALEEFKALSQFEAELEFLDENPLPASVVILPASGFQQASRVIALRDELVKIDGIEEIRLDLDWTSRFNAILSTVRNSTGVLAGLLAIALILVVGNTIKLLIINRRAEIEITKLVGGSNQFVRRPFLYFGSLFGLFGAGTALLLVLLVAHLLADPLSLLADQYQRDSLVVGLTWQEVLILLFAGTCLGWLAARIAVARHLGSIKPR